jgi:hypothetical protein
MRAAADDSLCINSCWDRYMNVVSAKYEEHEKVEEQEQTVSARKKGM